MTLIDNFMFWPCVFFISAWLLAILIILCLFNSTPSELPERTAHDGPVEPLPGYEFGTGLQPFPPVPEIQRDNRLRSVLEALDALDRQITSNNMDMKINTDNLRRLVHELHHSK